MKKAKLYKPKKLNNPVFKPKQESARDKGYDREWERYRYRYLHHNPNCALCNKPSKVVDHLYAAKIDRETLFWKVDNYLPMCITCHNVVTGKFDRHNPPLTQEKIKYIERMRKVNGINTSIKIVPFKKGSGLGR